MFKKVIAIDFDGVLHSYTSGWKGATNIPDAPVAGAVEWVTAALERFDVIVFSSRAHYKSGVKAISDWLMQHGFPPLLIVADRTSAHIILDDHGWCFDGVFPSLDEVEAFKPWHKR